MIDDLETALDNLAEGLSPTPQQVARARRYSLLTVMCPYCDKPCIAVDSALFHSRSFGVVWWCRKCDARVGAHKNCPAHTPLGIPANASLRRARTRAHGLFDPLWQEDKTVSRNRWYDRLTRFMGIPREQCHIGMFDETQCAKVGEFVDVYRRMQSINETGKDPLYG